MDIFIGIVILVITVIFGSLGFSQIIGSIKYPSQGSWITIIIWIAILGLVAFGAHHLLANYLTYFYIGYGISFLYSFSVKPD